MKNYCFFLFVYLFSHSIAFANSKGEANITIEGKSYTLPITICNKPVTEEYEGETVSHYGVYANNKKDGKAVYPKLSITGAKDSEETSAFYQFSFGSNTFSGDITYSGEMPFDIFKEGKLKFSGNASRSRSGDDTRDVPITIRLTCKS